MLGKVICFAGLLGASPVALAQQVSLSNEVKVVRTVVDGAGRKTTVYEAPKVVTPGDRLQFVLTYANKSGQPAQDFGLTNPMPTGVTFAGAETQGAVVSVDGGKSFGALAQLKVVDATGKPRPATASDVTHVRWKFAKPIAAGEQGSVKFEALVK